MKILQVLDCFSPLGGGVSSVVYKLSQALSGRGHDVNIYSTDFLTDAEYIESLEGVKVHPFKSIFTLGGLRLTPGVFKEARGNLGDFDIIHFHTYTSFINIPIGRYATKFGVPYILDVHGNLPGTDDKGRKKLFHNLFGKKLMSGAKKFVAETEVGCQEYMNLGISRDQVAIIPPGFDTDDLVDLPAEGGFREKFGIGQRRMVLYLGRIHEIKGLDFLMDAFEKLAGARDDIMLVIAGPDDGLQAELQEKANQRKLSDRIIFGGFLSIEDKKASLVDADVFVQPSRYEQGIAWTTVEAILCGLPLVATSGTGAAEDIEKMGAGYLVEFGDTDGMASIMEKVICDPTEADAMNKSGQEYIHENLSLKKKVCDFEDLYAECINGGGFRNIEIGMTETEESLEESLTEEPV